MASGHRALWKGFLKFGEVSCGVALYTAASTSERITFNSINKVTGNRVNRVFIDSETEERVEREDQTKGFEIENGHYIVIDPEEVAATEPGRRETRSQPRSTGSDRFCFLKRRTIVENRKPFRDLEHATPDGRERPGPARLGRRRQVIEAALRGCRNAKGHAKAWPFSFGAKPGFSACGRGSACARTRSPAAPR